MARKILILKWITLPAISSFTIIEKKFHTATTFFADTEKLVFIPPPSFKCVFTTGCPNRPFIFALYLIGPHANNYL